MDKKYQWIAGIAFGLLSTFMTSIYSKLESVQSDIRLLMVSQGIDHNEIQNLKEQIANHRSVNFPTPPIRTGAEKEKLVFVLPEEIDPTKRKSIL